MRLSPKKDATASRLSVLTLFVVTSILSPEQIQAGISCKPGPSRTWEDETEPELTYPLQFAPRAAPDKVGDKVGYEVRSTNFRKNAEIVVYCGGPNCPQS